MQSLLSVVIWAFVHPREEGLNCFKNFGAVASSERIYPLRWSPSYHWMYTRHCITPDVFIPGKSHVVWMWHTLRCVFLQSPVRGPRGDEQRNHIDNWDEVQLRDASYFNREVRKYIFQQRCYFGASFASNPQSNTIVNIMANLWFSRHIHTQSMCPCLRQIVNTRGALNAVLYGIACVSREERNTMKKANHFSIFTLLTESTCFLHSIFVPIRLELASTPRASSLASAFLLYTSYLIPSSSCDVIVSVDHTAIPVLSESQTTICS